MIGMEVRNKDERYVRRSKVEGCKLIDYEVFFIEMNRGHPAVKTHREFLRLFEEAIRIASVEKHCAEFGMTQKSEHGREMDRAPASALNGEMLGGSTVACVKNVDFHKSFLTTKYTKVTKEKPWCTL